MGDPNDYRNRVVRASSSRTILRIVAAVIAALVIGGMIYAHSRSRNDTSSAVTSAAPSPRP